MLVEFDFALFDFIDSFGRDHKAAVFSTLDPTFFAEVPKVKADHLFWHLHHFFDRNRTESR